MLIEIERCRLITLCQPTQRASACELARLSSLDVLFGRECTNLVSGNKIYVSKDPEFEFNYDFGCPRSFERHYSLFGFLRAANKLKDIKVLDGSPSKLSGEVHGVSTKL